MSGHQNPRYANHDPPYTRYANWKLPLYLPLDHVFDAQKQCCQYDQNFVSTIRPSSDVAFQRRGLPAYSLSRQERQNHYWEDNLTLLRRLSLEWDGSRRPKHVLQMTSLPFVFAFSTKGIHSINMSQMKQSISY